MSTVCAELAHKHYTSHHHQQQLQLFSLKKPFKDPDIPPRKLLLSKKTFQEFSPDHHMLIPSSPFESNIQKYLPCNDLINCGDDHDHENDHDFHDHHKGSSGGHQDLDPYSSDHFRMYEFKVRRCTRSRSHDWTDCPFAHPGEKARRRDPRKYHYSGVVCPEFRRGGCSRGDSCEFAHGVFECWLHPSRYRTEACKDGKNCKRKICFFAHSPRQLRILPEAPSSCGGAVNKYDHKHSHCCCLICHSVISSPTSTLLGMSHMSPPLSPSLSPPLSPVKQRSISGFSPISVYNDRLSKLRSSGIMSYKDVLTELMSSLEAMNFNEEAAAAAVAGATSPLSGSPVSANNNSIPWIDIASLNGEDHQQQQQFILSPSTPNGNFFNGDCSSNNKGLFLNDNINDHKINNNNNGGSSGGDPDLGWVNELLM